MAVVRPMTVGVMFVVEFETTASGEPEAILKLGPAIHELEEKLNRMGYNFRLDQVRVRRPQTAKKAQEREATRRRNGGQGE